ncbi:MAG: iron-containing alcohol dehydrogenase [bacterium]
MISYTWNRPVKILFGCGQLNYLGENILSAGKRCLLMIGGGSVIEHGYLDRTTNQLKKSGIEWILFQGVEPNPTAATVDRAASMVKREKCDFILALGGGSVMDAAKAAACLGKNPGKCWDYIRRDDKQKSFKEALPVVCVSTFAATGSEANGNAVISNPDTGEKIALINDAIIPRVSIVDPELTYSLSPESTAAGGIDIICHAMEKYWSQTGFDSYLYDRFAESIFKTVIEWLPRALENGKDPIARNNLAAASSYAMLGLNLGITGSFPLHMMEHPLSGIFNITHGFGLAALIPAALRFNCRKGCRMAAAMARNVFNVTTVKDEEAAEEGIICFENWMKNNNLVFKLSELGVKEDKLERQRSLPYRFFRIM